MSSKKLQQMGPPKKLAKSWRASGDPTGEQQRLANEAFLDTAEALGLTPEELKSKMTTIDFSKTPGAYGEYHIEEKRVSVDPKAAKSKAQFQDTLRHELFHAAGKGHRVRSSGYRKSPQEETEAVYWTPSLMQSPRGEAPLSSGPLLIDPETGKPVDRPTRDSKLIKLMADWGVENPEAVLAETNVANELFGPYLGNEKHDLPMEEKKKRLQRLRQRGYGKE